MPQNICLAKEVILSGIFNFLFYMREVKTKILFDASFAVRDEFFKNQAYHDSDEDNIGDFNLWRTIRKHSSQATINFIMGTTKLARSWNILLDFRC